VASLRELQASFAAALRDPSRPCPVTPPANLAVYRNNVAITFRETLERCYPVVLQRVGADYFRQLVHFYRERYPSRSGDLHWVGRDFAPFLAAHLAGGEYAWLADLAALEWAREEAAVAAERAPVGVESLAGVPADELEHLTFELQPSLRLVGSPFPIFRVWRANQQRDAPPVDQSVGPEHVLVRIQRESVEMQRIAADCFAFLSALERGADLGTAMTAAEVDGARLTELLGFVFGAALVCGVARAANGRAAVAVIDDGQRVGTSS
jgi:hypothetical protein